MKRIYSSFNLAAVHHARNLLDAEGIRAVVKNEMLSSAMGELPPAECQTELWVLRDSEAARAEAVLRSAFSSKSGPPWACASCGEREHLGAFSASAGGVVCPGCEAGSFALDEEAHSFLVHALGRQLADFPTASDRALGQADRAIAETLEHHAHVRLRRVAA